MANFGTLELDNVSQHSTKHSVIVEPDLLGDGVVPFSIDPFRTNTGAYWALEHTQLSSVENSPPPGSDTPPASSETMIRQLHFVSPNKLMPDIYKGPGEMFTLTFTSPAQTIENPLSPFGIQKRETLRFSYEQSHSTAEDEEAQMHAYKHAARHFISLFIPAEQKTGTISFIDYFDNQRIVAFTPDGILKGRDVQGNYLNIKDWGILGGIILNNAQNNIYSDTAFDMMVPMSEKLTNYHSFSKNFYANVESKYNFYIESYETAQGSNLIPEQILPNIYAFSSFASKDSSTDFLNFISLHGAIKCNFQDLYGPIKSPDFKLAFETKNHGPDYERMAGALDYPYFEFYANAYPLANSLDLSKSITKYSNFIITNNVSGIFKEYNIYKQSFPMYAAVSFDTDKNSKAANYLKKANLVLPFMKSLASNWVQIDPPAGMESIPDTLFQESSGANFRSATEVFVPSTTEEPPLITEIPNNLALRRFNIIQWLDMYADPNTQVINHEFIKDNTVIIGDKSAPDTEFSTFIKQLGYMVLISSLENLTKKQLRTYASTMRGTKAHTETLAYRVEKIKTSTAGIGDPTPAGEVVQTFWVANAHDIKKLQYVDTQVRYGETYEYKIYAYNLVFGSKYTYDFNKCLVNTAKGPVLASPWVVAADKSPASPPYFEFDVNTVPTLTVIEVPYFNQVTHISDDPPLPPNVDITPFVGVKNKILISLNNSTGDIEIQPMYIEEEDGNQHTSLLYKQEKMLQDKDNNYLNTKITYKSDDFAKYYQIYRSETKPINPSTDPNSVYKSFQGKKIAELETAKEAGFIDMIAPNKKYYYTFRSIDSHGLVSFPTQVYQVEMVENSGANYLLIDIVEFDSPKKTKTTKSMKKYIMIEPALAQEVLNFAESNLSPASALDFAPPKPILGDVGADQSIFNDKKFKIRIRSKNSGRVFDLNVRFESKLETDDAEMLKKSSACDPLKLPVDTNGVVLEFEAVEGTNVEYGGNGVENPLVDIAGGISLDYP